MRREAVRDKPSVLGKVISRVFENRIDEEEDECEDKQQYKSHQDKYY